MMTKKLKARVSTICMSQMNIYTYISILQACYRQYLSAHVASQSGSEWRCQTDLHTHLWACIVANNVMPTYDTGGIPLVFHVFHIFHVVINHFCYISFPCHSGWFFHKQANAKAATTSFFRFMRACNIMQRDAASTWHGRWQRLAMTQHQTILLTK